MFKCYQGLHYTRSKVGFRLYSGYWRRLFKRIETQYVMCVINRIQENQFIKELFLSIYVAYQIYQVYPSMTLDFYSYSKLSKLILSS